MQIHQLKRVHPNKAAKQFGRGGKRGKTSGRGTKGQRARSGRKLRPEMRDIIKKLPKKRGYRFQSLVAVQSAIINLETLEKYWAGKEVVTPTNLVTRGLLNKRFSLTAVVKILARGTLTKPLVIKGCLVSAGARAKIEAAGGQISA